ncbi:RNase P subunit RPR2 [Methanonatronarchaeum thermophilum]|uniref:Ribonuclease P protein component 4 n=1 Tax=Methanonatronarchaeum thermophilum TaxID=1927129 RepID=A0A1Y3GDJ0_9EURY|nr:ribonuclease P Rpr2/Rpp21/SNM1 subunit [Methanonatronarchaeum thermophilum]OUJ18264.1 RNase P subunit RPR2 [Methanonatronarchaeum thermophilum]
MTKNNTKDLAKQRIEKLFKQARKKHHKNPELSHRYMEIAWKLKLKTRTKLPEKYKHQICRKCQSYQIPGKNQQTRIHRSKIIKKCKKCGHTTRIHLNQKQKTAKD